MHQPSRSHFDLTLPVVLGASTGTRPSVTGRLLRWAAALASLPARLAAIRRDMAILGGMDDRDLADIGLCRQDLRDAVALPLGEHPGSLFQDRVRSRRRRYPSRRPL